MVGPDKMIGGCLRRGIGTVRTVRRFLGEIPLPAKTSVHLVGADVVENTEAAAGAPGRFKEVERSDDVGLYKAVRLFDGTVHMGLRREMTDGIDPMAVKNTPERIHVADIRFLEKITFRMCFFDAFEVVGVSGIG